MVVDFWFRKDKHTDRLADGWTDRWRDRWKDGRTDEKSDITLTWCRCPTQIL